MRELNALGRGVMNETKDDFNPPARSWKPSQESKRGRVAFFIWTKPSEVSRHNFNRRERMTPGTTSGGPTGMNRRSGRTQRILIFQRTLPGVGVGQTRANYVLPGPPRIPGSPKGTTADSQRPQG